MCLFLNKLHGHSLPKHHSRFFIDWGRVNSWSLSLNVKLAISIALASLTPVVSASLMLDCRRATTQIYLLNGSSHLMILTIYWQIHLPAEKSFLCVRRFQSYSKSHSTFITGASGKWSRLAYLDKRVIDEACIFLPHITGPTWKHRVLLQTLIFVWSTMIQEQLSHKSDELVLVHIRQGIFKILFFAPKLSMRKICYDIDNLIKIWKSLKKYSLIVSPIHHLKFPFSFKIYIFTSLTEWEGGLGPKPGTESWLSFVISPP